VLCYAVLCYAMLCHAMPCYAMLCHCLQQSPCQKPMMHTVVLDQYQDAVLSCCKHITIRTSAGESWHDSENIDRKRYVPCTLCPHCICNHSIITPEMSLMTTQIWHMHASMHIQMQIHVQHMLTHIHKHAHTCRVGQRVLAGRGACHARCAPTPPASTA